MAGLVPAISIHGGGGAAFSLSPFTGRGWRAPDGASRVAVHGSSSDPPSLKLRRVDLARIAGREKRHAVCAVQNLDSNLKQRFGGAPPPVFLAALPRGRPYFSSPSTRQGDGVPSGAPVFPLAALEWPDFAAGGGKNYPYVPAFRGEPDFEAIAILMLTALHDTYAARHL